MKKGLLSLICCILFLPSTKTLSNISNFENRFFNPSSSYMTEEDFVADFSDAICTLDKNADVSNITKYFKNLYKYSPENSYGSCGYVSFIQYLSYYDTFYNDSIIPENYEQYDKDASNLEDATLVSPGVLKNSYPESSTELYLYIKNNINIDYQAYLMSLVNKGYKRSSDEYRWSTHMRDYRYIVDSINVLSKTSFSYKTFSDFSGASFPNDYASKIGLESYVKSFLNKNQPVMLHIAKYNKATNNYWEDYHSVVAYYYDEKGIHANFGWGPSSTDVILEGTDYYITEAGVIDFDKVAMQHSNNYYANTEHYCGCGLKTDHILEYSRFTTDLHKANCVCGYKAYEHHCVDESKAVRGYGICQKCYAKVNIWNTPIEKH